VALIATQEPQTAKSAKKLIMISAGKAALFSLLVMLLLNICVFHADAYSEKKVLVIYCFKNLVLPGMEIINQSMSAALESTTTQNISFFYEYLDASRLSDDRYLRLTQELYHYKYTNIQFDLIVGINMPSAGFYHQLFDGLVSEAPAVFAIFNQNEADTQIIDPAALVFNVRFDMAGTLQTALRLHPDTRRVAVIAGASPFSQKMEGQAKQDFKAYEDRVSFTYLTGLPMEELLEQVSHLPQQTIIFYLSVFNDRDGKVFVPRNVMQQISKKAPVPVYTAISSYLGFGTVGGSMFSLEKFGKSIGEAGLSFLQGRGMKGGAALAGGWDGYMFDWRELQRWNIPESNLPSDSIVMHKQLSVWERYRWRIIGGIALIMLQAALITFLLINRSVRLRTQQALSQSERRFKTEQKQAEMEAQQHREELAHVLRIATTGELSAAMAHELNQPLTAILSNAQAAQRFLGGGTPDIDELKEILADIVDDDKRAGEVIRRFRLLLKKSEIQLERLNMNEVIQEVVALIHNRATFKNVSVPMDLDRNLPSVKGDKIQLQQVILNLIMNAFDVMEDLNTDSGKLMIKTRKGDEGMIIISVRDTGTGIDQENLEKIFEPFYTTKSKGMGMGLSINMRIIEAHGGRLWAENNPGHGATFYFTLPVA
jgi:signal transduction histidine kinase